jgi:hypothetical protein
MLSSFHIYLVSHLPPSLPFSPPSIAHYTTLYLTRPTIARALARIRIPVPSLASNVLCRLAPVL